MSTTKIETAQVILTDCDDAIEEVKAAHPVIMEILNK